MGDNYTTNWNDIDWERADWENFARHLSHRVELELTAPGRKGKGIPWTEFYKRVGKSGTYITKVRRGKVKRLKETTARLIEQAAQWEPGSIASTLMGGKPIPTEKAKLAPAASAESSTVSVSADSGASGQSPPTTESEFERFRRWSGFVGEVFTPAAFMQLQQDLATVYREGYQQALQDRGNR